MQVRTIDQNFDYQVDEILKKLHSEWDENIKESGLPFADWMWKNLEEVGKAFYERVDEYQSIEETIENLGL